MGKIIAPDVLRRVRLARSFSQSELAEAMGVGLTTVRSWEAGRRSPSPRLHARLCQILQVSPEELAGQECKPVPSGFSAFSFPQESQKPSQRDENRHRFLTRVRHLWIDGVLAYSLYQEVVLDLGLQTFPEAVANPWRFSVQETTFLPTQLVPEGTTIAQVYEAADRELLILGGPGAGKTTLLFILAQTLLLQAEQRNDAPLPALFHLSSWSEKYATLAEWLVEELFHKYRVPHQVGRIWVEHDHLALFLDGLDEMAERQRSACLHAIMAYSEGHLSVPLAVTCRTEEYFALDCRLPLQAVLIQPLSREQIEIYLSCARLENVQKTLQDDPVFFEMLHSPLMLSIVSLTVSQQEHNDLLTGPRSLTPEERRQRILHAYVQRMLQRRGVSRYSAGQTIRWLAWLARQMKRTRREFAVEHLQPDGLPSNYRRQYESAVLRIYYGLSSLLFGGLFSWLRGGRRGAFAGVGEGLLGWLGAGPGNEALGWMAPGIGGGIEGGGSFALILLIVASLLSLFLSYEPAFSRKALKAGFFGGLKAGILGGIFFGLLGVLVFFPLLGNLQESLLRGGGVGVIGGLAAALIPGLTTWLHADDPPDPSPEQRSWSTLLGDGLSNGLCTFLGFVGAGLLLHLNIAPLIVDGAILSLGAVFLFSTRLGKGVEVVRGLGKEIVPVELVSWSWSQVFLHLSHTLRKGGAVAGIISFLLSIIVIGSSSLSYGFAYGFRYGLLSSVMIGFILAVISVFAILLKRGWNSQMLSKHHHFKPNAGIIRSAWHGVVAGCCFGLVGGLCSWGASGIAFGLIGRLPTWPLLALGFALAMGIEIAVTAFFLQGGLACLEHYLLRWYLQRAGCLPFQVVPFLDDAVKRIFLRRIGGEYLFIHTILLDYFASLEEATNSTTNS